MWFQGYQYVQDTKESFTGLSIILMHGNQINKLPVNYFFGLNVNRSSALELQGYTIKDIQAATQWCSQEKVF